jgi:hypothetical protein
MVGRTREGDGVARRTDRFVEAVLATESTPPSGASGRPTATTAVVTGAGAERPRGATRTRP